MTITYSHISFILKEDGEFFMLQINKLKKDNNFQLVMDQSTGNKDIKFV